MKEPRFIQLGPQGKIMSRVIISCDPTEGNKNLLDMADEILSVMECSIFYLEDQSWYPQDLEDYYVQLRNVNLFVFPITFSFLAGKSRAKNIDFEYAISNHIPVLAVLVEPRLYDLFNRFHTIQVLDKTTNEATAETYRHKFESFIRSVLSSDRDIKRIEDEFSDFIFLSYRKKDRKKAQDVMSLIHKNEFMRDVAIWYDEFLTPGEDFNAEIEKYLKKSKLVSMVITPNIIEKTNGVGNYVMEKEYPAMINLGKPVLPIEATSTSIDELKENFEGIEKPISISDSESVKNVLGDMFHIENENNDLEHLYFISLAYMNGVYAVKDTAKAMEILRHLAGSGYYPAIKKLAEVYENGIGTQIDLQEAIKYQEKAVEVLSDDFSEEYYDELLHLSYLYESTRRYDDAWKCAMQCYEETKGENHPNELEFLRQYAFCYKNLGKYGMAKTLFGWYYQECERTLGPNSRETIQAIHDLSTVLSFLPLNNFNGSTSLGYDEDGLLECVNRARNYLGDSNQITLEYENDLAVCYLDERRFKSAIELLERVFEKAVNIYGEEHPFTIVVMDNLGFSYGEIERYSDSFYLLEKCFRSARKVYSNSEESNLESISKDLLSVMYWLSMEDTDEETKVRMNACLDDISSMLEEEQQRIADIRENIESWE